MMRNPYSYQEFPTFLALATKNIINPKEVQTCYKKTQQLSIWRGMIEKTIKDAV